jgi:ribonuclease Z
MLVQVSAGPLCIRGVSVGGIYTCLHVPALDAVLDTGLAPRSMAAANHIFLSHGHADHAGALAALLGIRALLGKSRPPRLYLPREIAGDLQDALAAMSRLQRHPLVVHPVPMAPGDTEPLGSDLWVRALRTYHPVPSLAYEFVRRINKLRPEYRDLSGPEIAARRRRGDQLFDQVERCELAYATDTLALVLDREPSLLRSRVLVLECTFLDERKDVATARAGCHIHLDELIERADRFENEAVVLMHFSQIYRPDEVRQLLDRRCPPRLRERLVPLLPRRNSWPG